MVLGGCHQLKVGFMRWSRCFEPARWHRVFATTGRCNVEERPDDRSTATATNKVRAKDIDRRS